jgi:hypothetical protein
MIGTQGCYIYEGKKHPLNIAGIFNLFFIYCTIFFKWFYELILLVLIFLAVTINGKLGAWVAIVTIITWFINRKRLSSFRQNFLQKMDIDAEDWLTANQKNLLLYNADADVDGCDSGEKDADGNLTATASISEADKENINNVKGYKYNNYSAVGDIGRMGVGVAAPVVGAVGTAAGLLYGVGKGAEYAVTNAAPIVVDGYGNFKKNVYKPAVEIMNAIQKTPIPKVDLSKPFAESGKKIEDIASSVGNAIYHAPIDDSTPSGVSGQDRLSISDIGLPSDGGVEGVEMQSLSKPAISSSTGTGTGAPGTGTSTTGGKINSRKNIKRKK